MMHLAWPWCLLALPLPWLLARWLPPAGAQGAALFLPFAADLRRDDEHAAASRPTLQRVLLALIWLLLVGAAVRPQWLGEPQAVPTTGRRLLMAVDVSGSMDQQDMAGGLTRLQVVQKVAGDFIERRHGDQVGLILFATQPYLQAPLTRDLQTVKQFLNEAAVGMAGRQTAIGDAIGLALKRLRNTDTDTGTDTDTDTDTGSDGESPGETVLILLTDGASNAGTMPPAAAARLAADAGLKIYTIGVGAESGSGFFGMLPPRSDLDENTLQAVADATGGAYFRAADAQGLEQVYARIDRLEPSAGREQWYRPRSEWFVWPLALALLLSVPTVLLRELRR